MRRISPSLPLALVVLTACGSTETDAAFQDQVTTGMKQLLLREVGTWKAAATRLRDAAPTPAGRGWDAVQDAAALTAMKTAWNDARVPYERIEGAIAPLFPDSDTATDARYDDYLAELGPAGDAYLFDDQGVVGVHGIERILYADRVPEFVLTFERGLPGYQAPRFPNTAAEAADFKAKLATRLVADVTALEAMFAPLQLDLGFAFGGVIDLVNEQAEKVIKTASGEEESRYSQLTLRDLRANYEGCAEVYGLFRPWVRSKSDGPALDERVTAALARLKAAYDAVPGDAMPQPPATWSSETPTAADLATPFGKLYAAVNQESDPAVSGSLHGELKKAVTLMGLAE